MSKAGQAGRKKKWTDKVFCAIRGLNGFGGDSRYV